ncbi:hypothetical protein NEA10_15080 [Phormidium yuhuli AB48]|uniref:Uncharacterized protein n=1 Tax=Phormidium yuhuli AB48 TaxID=2940671 RepID=A0ABY5API4_9CYAN|nr:hypothetical protein [Phormidium yuhuli]USR90159.1 hypothetical protein NEA10_15080 [Phormidium yuhuli AB48]
MSTTDQPADKSTSRTSSAKTRTARTRSTSSSKPEETKNQMEPEQGSALTVQGGEARKALDLKPADYLPGNRPVGVSHREIVDTFSAVGGLRPIFSNDVNFTQTMKASGVRPISASTLAISETYNTMGNRPISASGMKVSSTIQSSGIRPVSASTLVISDTVSIMGNRPVAANATADIDALMGYLD